jgi:hypothetical protein
MPADPRRILGLFGIGFYPDQFAVERWWGLETPRELMQKAVDLLPVDEGPLAEFLIEIIEETAPE